MTGYGDDVGTTSDRYTINAGRYWASAVAAALVAALVAIAGVLIARGLFDVPVLARRSHGAWGDAHTATYATGAALATLLAAGLLHLLTLAVAEPRRFFRWIMALITLIGVITPLTLADKPGPRIATALITLAIGVTITAILDSVASATSHPRPAEQRDALAATRRWTAEPPTYRQS
ncbi:hypothetical protein ACWT_0243 [Actinoplanes sp. SE50]|uniref:DUF6069 family protein n=1 Tax=unclassified Actinoplanes TaxID=2626549 RepID=UPI00023EBE47|nr:MULTISPECIES: DUF6069 family protein [unclassified Actinoplanes]AEV81255.1 hypothetical protein ACPL_358 [Actinoplanes sp. SE50/110]ATO79658.1 hypothetical protein ACWT_0243 [Actinoplanes sp. SE50]SLL97061.1 hypothetical protein ACSP50_0257 [Actinoplanes sp. SE50/110]